MSANYICLDDILKEIGDFGKFQYKVVILISIATAFTCIPVNVWILETKQLNYRCEISECETDPLQYKPSWWTDAIPSVNNEPSNCERYKLLNSSKQPHKCIFDKNVVEACDKYVYETNKTTILRDFNLHCKGNVWKLTLVGTINSVGLFLGLLISGVLSDKFGRKMTLISSIAFSALMGIIRSFTNSYIFYVFMTFADAFCRAAAYPTCVIIGVELVRPSKRALVILLINTIGGIFGSFVGVAAWMLPTWRALDRVIYTTCLLIVLYYWFIPESIRWLLANAKYADAENILQKISKTNGTTLSQEHIHALWNMKNSDNANSNTTNTANPLRRLLNSHSLIKLLIHCSICWVCCTLSLYGLMINSVSLSKNSYLDFTLTVLVDIPACIAVYLLVDRIGRRNCLAMGFLICGVSCVSFILLPKDLYWLKLTTYLFGKFGTAINILIIYTLTSELFPTTLRSSLLSICSMAGRIGSMVAPQTRLLALYWEPFPLTLLQHLQL